MVLNLTIVLNLLFVIFINKTYFLSIFIWIAGMPPMLGIDLLVEKHLLKKKNNKEYICLALKIRASRIR